MPNYGTWVLGAAAPMRVVGVARSSAGAMRQGVEGRAEGLFQPASGYGGGCELRRRRKEKMIVERTAPIKAVASGSG